MANWYPAINNSSVGIDGMFNYTTQAMTTQSAMMGGNIIGILFFIPFFLILYFPLSRYDPVGAFTVSSFICWIISMYMMANGYVGEIVFGAFLGMWIIGGLFYYLKTRS